MGIVQKRGFLPRKPQAEWPEPRTFKINVNTSIQEVLSSELPYESKPFIPFRDKLIYCSCEKRNGYMLIQERGTLVGKVCTTCNGVVAYWYLPNRSWEEA